MWHSNADKWKTNKTMVYESKLNCVNKHLNLEMVEIFDGKTARLAQSHTDCNAFELFVFNV